MTAEVIGKPDKSGACDMDAERGAATTAGDRPTARGALARQWKRKPRQTGGAGARNAGYVAARLSGVRADKAKVGRRDRRDRHGLRLQRVSPVSGSAVQPHPPLTAPRLVRPGPAPQQRCATTGSTDWPGWRRCRCSMPCGMRVCRRWLPVPSHPAAQAEPDSRSFAAQESQSR